jgi:hypothetical protein
MERYFEWDETKAEINFFKHGIRFDEAALVFDDPFSLSSQDRIENGEDDGRPSVWLAIPFWFWSPTPCVSRMEP